MNIQAEIARLEKQRAQGREFIDAMNRHSAKLLADMEKANWSPRPYALAGVVIGGGLFGLGMLLGKLL